MFVKSITLVFISFVASVLADVFITSPTSSSVFTGGQEAVIKWQDNGQSPSLAQWGHAKISIYIGNAIQQTSVQLISNDVDVSQTSSISFIPNPAIGPNSNEFFIRVESLSLKDAKDPQYPALAFSSKFAMKGMTGTFNATEQSQINGQSTAPIQSPTSSAASSANSTSPTASSKSTRAVSSPSSTGATNAAAAAAASVRSNCLIFLFAATTVVGVAAVF